MGTSVTDIQVPPGSHHSQLTAVQQPKPSGVHQPQPLGVHQSQLTGIHQPMPKDNKNHLAVTDNGMLISLFLQNFDCS